jgi:hypothetical protein
MRRSLFEFVDQIREASKYFDVSRQEILRELLVKGKCQIVTEHDVNDRGDTITAPLRLNVAAHEGALIAWTVALKLHNIRIDGIDYEAKFRTVNGDVAHGWHRHQWSASDESADVGKIPIDILDDITTREEFLIRSFKLLRISLNPLDHGQDILRFD